MRLHSFGKMSLLLIGLATLGAACGSSDDSSGDQPGNDAGGGSTDSGSGSHDDGGSVITDAGVGTDGSTGATITVAGRVLSNQGQPLVGLPVVIGSSTPTLTDATGHFSIAGVTAPYTATFVSAQKVYSFEGLTRTDPNLLALVDTYGILSQDVTGTLSGGAGYPEGANMTTNVAFRSSASGQAGSGSMTGTSAFDITGTQWSIAPSISGNVYALQYTHGAAATEPVSYEGFAKLAGITLTNSATANAVGNIALTGGISTSNLTATITMPATYSVLGRLVAMNMDGLKAINLPAEDSPAASTISYTTPVISGATMSIMVSAEAPGVSVAYTSKGGLAANASNVPIVIHAPPVPGAPVAGASGITSSVSLSWTAYDTPGVYFVTLTSEGLSAGSPSYCIVTADRSTKLPDVSAVGIQFPKSEMYHWTADGVGGKATVDDFTASEIYPPQEFTDLSLSRASAITFTTAP
ncbi:MAG: hypothetical protein ABI183_26035 [Polyangiaceae bacterium]